MKVDFSPSPAKSEVASHRDTYTQHFLKTLPRKLHDPTLLQVFPRAPSPVIFKHNDKNELAAREYGTTGKDVPFQGPPQAWGSPKHPITAPPGSYKLLSSDYAWLDAPRNRRDGHGAAAPASQEEGEGTPLPEPPLAMQQTRFLAHARLVLVKLRQQLEEVCVGAIRRMETVVTAAPVPTDMAATPALSTLGSFGGSTAAPALTSMRSMAATSIVTASGGVSTAATGGGATTVGPRLPPGFVDELVDNIHAKLNAAFEDCLVDTMDQLWNALQYAGSKHAIVDRLAEAMKRREMELEMTAARHREDSTSKIRILRRQKDEVEAAAEKERVELQARAAAASQRMEFLERDMSALRGAVERERAEGAARLEAQRVAYEAALAAKDEAMEAVGADSVARLEEMRVLNAGLQEQLALRTEEVSRLSSRATDQADILALALDRRDGTFKELEVLTGQLEDYKRFVQAPAAMPLTDWLLTLQENGSLLTPLMGGPLSMEYGTGRAFMATARNHGLHAVQEELRRIMPSELPWPEDGWPSDGQDGDFGEATGGTEGTAGRSSPTDMIGKAAYPHTLPLTWLRFARAPLANIMSGPELMSILSRLAKAKREVDVVARHHGQSAPDLHAFVYKRILEQQSSAMDADEVVISLVQSLRAHAKNLPRAAIWLQLLQLANPVLPPDAATYYMEVFHLLLVQEGAVVDKAACIVWVSPTRWKTLLTGPAGSVFDTERKVALLKQAASVRVDTTRGNKSFGMSEGDALIPIIMAQWLSQRQAAIASLAAAWSAQEPVGGGVLAVNISVDELARVATTALGRDALPTDHASLLELYFNTLQAARAAQVAARVKWSGLTTAALGTALADAELLSPRPLHPRNSPSRTRLATASAQLLRLADAATEQMRPHAMFKQQQCMVELESALTRLRQGVQECTNSRELVRDVIEEERRALLGWVELETTTTALLTAQEAFRVFEASMRDQTMKMAMETLSKRKSMSDDAEKGVERLRSATLSTRPSALRNIRSKSYNRNVQSSDNGSSPNEGSPVQSPRSEFGSAFSAPSAQLAVGRMGRMASARSHSASGRTGSPRAAARDLRAALAGAGGQWSSDEEQQGTPTTLSLPGRMSRVTRSSSKPAPRERLEAPEEALAALVAAAAESPGSSGNSSSGSHGSTGEGSSSAQPPPVSEDVVEPSAAETPSSRNAAPEDHEAVVGATMSRAASYSDPNAVDRLTHLEDKYGRLRSRFSQTMRALNAAYQNAAGDAGAGLPCPEVMSQLGPAAKLRLVAELLAELHREVEEGVWPHLDDAVIEAIGRTSRGGGSSSSRAASRPPSAMVPGLHITALRPWSGANSSLAPSTAGTITGAAVASGPAADVLNAEAYTAARTGSAARTVTGSGSASEGSHLGGARLPRISSKLSDVELALSQVGGEFIEEEGEEPGAPGAEVQEVAGLLHAHAGHVGRVISVAAMETAALAAALEDLSSRRSGTSTASLLRGSLTRAGTSDGGGAPGSGTEGGMWPAGNGTTQGGLSSDGSVPSRSMGSTPGRLTAGGDMAALLSGLAPVPSAALLHRSATLQAGIGSGGVLALTPIPTLRPASAGTLGSLHPALSMSSMTSRAYGHGTGTGDTGGAPTVSASGGSVSHGVQAEPQGSEGVWSGITPDADPRDTTYLEALRALHAAAESQALTEGNVTQLVGAVREVVRLLGGQPQIGGDGSVIEFYPRRVPTDWRHPVLRNSLTRLYIYVCGALLQQHERGLLLQEAAADLTERHTALVRAAEDLELKAAGLRGLQTTLGRQLAALGSWATHGSVLMSRLEKLDAAGEELKVRMAMVHVSERSSPPVVSPTIQSRSTSMRTQPSAVQPSASGSVKNIGELSRATSMKVSTRVQTSAQSAAAREVATVAGVAAAAAAAAAAATMVLPLAGVGEGLTASGGATSSSGVVGAAAAKAARPPIKIVGFSPDEWDAMKQVASNVIAAILHLKGSVWPLVGLVSPALVQGASALAPPSTPGIPLPPAPMLLPTGDRILAVHVHITSSSPSDRKPRLTDADSSPTTEAFAASQLVRDGNSLTTTQPLELPQQSKVQQQQDTISFIIDLPLTTLTTGASTGAAPAHGKPPSNRTETAKPTAVNDARSDTDKYPTPPVSREGSIPSMAPAAAATQGYSLRMSLRQAQTAPRSSSAGSALPPGEELVRLSNSLLRRSAVTAIRKHLGGGGGINGGAGGRRPIPSPHPAVDGMGPLPPHYERRPMTARAFVEGVMMQAREQQLERLYGVAGHMPRGAMPELDGLAHTDEHEASLLEQRALVLASPDPKPVTALDILLQEHSEEAAQANVAAVSAVADAVLAATAAAAGAQPPAGPTTPRTDAGAPLLVSSVSPPRQEGPRRQASRPTSDGSVLHSRLVSGVSSTRLSTLPPVGGAALAGMGGDSALSVPSAHLGYYPGLQVDVAGRLTDWRLPVLTQQPSQRSVPSERGASQQGAA